MRLDPLFVVLASLIGRGCGEAAELRTKDVPEACLVICNPVVLLSNACYIEEDAPSSSSSSSPILVIPVSTVTQRASQTEQQTQTHTQQQMQPQSAFAPAIIQPQAATVRPSNNTNPTFTSQYAQQTQYRETSMAQHPPPPNATSRPYTPLEIEISGLPPVPLHIEGGVVEHYVALAGMGNSDPSLGGSASAQKVQVGNSPAEKEAAEKFCLCQNKSFDVQSLAGLCASCMAQNTNSSDQLSDINKIMSECTFTSTTYTPEATKSAEDLTIVALVPTLVPVNGPQPSSVGSGDQNSDNDSGDESEEGLDDVSSSSATRMKPLDEELKYMLYLLSPLVTAFLCL